MTDRKPINLQKIRNIVSYIEICIEELYQVIHDHIDDLKMFCFYYKEFLKQPEKYGITFY